LYLYLHLHKQGELTPKIELTAAINLFKYTDIKTLTINLKYKAYCSYQQQLKYDQQIQYLRQCVQKYCNDMHITIHFLGLNYECDFWNNASCTKLCYCTKSKVAKDRQWLYGCKKISRAMIDKTKYNFHRNFKLEQRKI